MKRFLVACGPGTINTISTGEYSGNTDEYPDYGYNQGKADQIQVAIEDDLKAMGGLDALSEYCDTNGITKITFKQVKNINNRYYLEWEVEAEDIISDSDIEKFKNWMTGQMSDGWGEGFEQHPFNTYEDTQDYEYEEEVEDEDGETHTEYETDYETVRCEDYFSPWTYRRGWNYDVLMEEIDSIQESKKSETDKLTEQARIKWMVKVSHGQKYSSDYEFATKHEAEDKFNELVNEPGTDMVELCKVSSDPELIPTGTQRMTFKRRGGIDYYMAVKTQKQQPAEMKDLKFEDLEISDTADDFADAYMESTRPHGTVIKENRKWRLNPDKLAKESIQKISAPLNEELNIKTLRINESTPKKTDELKKWLKESGEYDWEDEEEKEKEDPWVLLDDYVAQYGPENFTIILSRYISDAEPEFFPAYDRQLAELQEKTGEGTEETLNGILQWLGHNDGEYLIFDCIEELKAESIYTKDLKESKLEESFNQIDLLYSKNGFRPGRGGRGFAKSNTYAVQCTHPNNVYNDLKYFLDKDGSKVYHQFRINVKPCALENALENSISVEEFMKRYEAGEFSDEFKESKLTENSKDPYKLAKKYNLDVFELRGIDVSNDPAMTTYIAIAPDHRVSGSWTVCLTDTEEIKAYQKHHQNGNWLVAVHKPFQYYADACDWIEQHIDRNDTLEGDPVLSESKLKESYTDPDLLDDLVKAYIHNDMITSDEIWDEIMARYDDEDLANDVLTELEAEGWHCAFEESKIREYSSSRSIKNYKPQHDFKKTKKYQDDEGLVGDIVKIVGTECGNSALPRVPKFFGQFRKPKFDFSSRPEFEDYKKKGLEQEFSDFKDALGHKGEIVKALPENSHVKKSFIIRVLDGPSKDKEFEFYPGEFYVIKGRLDNKYRFRNYEESKESDKSRLREATSGLKITDYQIDERWIFDTFKDAIIINAQINNKDAKFIFRANRGGDIFFTGISCDYVRVPREADSWGTQYTKEIRIANSIEGAGFWASPLQIYPDVLKSAPKKNQKDFRFTGRYYSTAPIKDAFRQKLMYLYQKDYLTKEFCDYFSIPPYGTDGSDPTSKSADSVEKMKKWQAGERGFNLKAASDAKLKANLKICREIGFDEGADKIQAELDSRKTNALDESISIKESKLKEAGPKGWAGFDPDETFNRIDNDRYGNGWSNGPKYFLKRSDFEDLRKEYQHKLYTARDEYKKAHPEYRDEYKAVQAWQDEARHKYWNAEKDDPELAELAKKIADAERYSDYARRKGWWSTVKKQEALRGQMQRELDSKKKARYDYNSPESEVYKTRPSAEHIDAYWALEDPIIDEYKKEQDRREQEFADALKDKKIYLGSLEGDDGKISKAFFRNTDDPKVFRRIGSRGSSDQPYGPNRGYTRFFISPDPRTEFEDYPEDKIKGLKEFDPYGRESNGEWDSTD